MKMKTCFTCKGKWPATTEYYHKNMATRDGLKGECKKCVRIRLEKYHEKRKRGEAYSAEALKEEEAYRLRREMEKTKYPINKWFEAEIKEWKDNRFVKGRVVFENERFVILESKEGIRESFLKADTLTGRIKLREI